jgi:hypothetical protein
MIGGSLFYDFARVFEFRNVRRDYFNIRPLSAISGSCGNQMSGFAAPAHVRFWHKAGIPPGSIDVCF